MKLNVILSLIGVVIAALFGYLAFHIAQGKANDVLCAIASTVCFIATLVPAIGVKYDSERLGKNIKLVCMMFFVVFLVSHFCFAAFGVAMPYYIIVNGLLLMIYLAAWYKMQSIKDV